MDGVSNLSRDMAGLTPLFNSRDIERMLDKFKNEAEEKILEILIYAGENGVKEARLSGRYNDITGNLRSSIGYTVLKNGKPVKESFEAAEKGTDRATGVKEAKRLVKEVAREHSKGYALILVAGMEYAVYVESIEGKDVLSGAVIGTERFLRDTLKQVTNG